MPPPPIPGLITIRFTNPPFGAGSAGDAAGPIVSQSTLRAGSDRWCAPLQRWVWNTASTAQVGRGGLRDRPAAVAEGVGLVEEHDDAAVAQRELAQLAEQGLHLHDADADEHGLEGARVDEHVGTTGLAGHGLGHERLARAGRPPEEDAAGHVAALALDLLRLLEEDDVLLDPVEHVVLAPDVGEPGLHLGRHVGLDAALRHEPEDGHELQDGHPHEEHDVEQRRHALERSEGQVPQPARGLGQRRQRRHTPQGAEDAHGDDGEDREPERPVDAVAEPRVHLVDPAVPRAPDVLLPELVVGRRALADEDVDLAEDLQPGQTDAATTSSGAGRRWPRPTT